MKQVLRFVAMMSGVGVVVAVSTGLAAENFSYSGKYSAQHVKGTPSGSPDSVLEVVQSENDIEITRVESGKRTTSRCPFNGPEGDYTSPGGVAGKCKAQLKGKKSHCRVCCAYPPTAHSYGAYAYEGAMAAFR